MENYITNVLRQIVILAICFAAGVVYSHAAPAILHTASPGSSVASMALHDRSCTATGGVLGNLVVCNNTSTWAWIEQVDDIGDPSGSVWLLGPNGSYTIPNFVLNTGEYIRVRGITANGMFAYGDSDCRTALMGVLMIDLMSRGLFTFETPANSFTEGGRAFIKENLEPVYSAFSGFFTDTDIFEAAKEGTSSALFSTIIGQVKDVPAFTDYAAFYWNTFAATKISAKFVDRAMGEAAQILSVPTRAGLLNELSQGTSIAAATSWERIAWVETTAAAELVESVSPATLHTAAVGTLQTLDITGKGFTPATILIFATGKGERFVSRADRLTYVSPTHMRYGISVGSELDTWVVSTEKSVSSASFTVVADVSTLHSIAATGGSGGTISPSGVTQKVAGESIDFAATPVPGYAVDKWFLDGALIREGGEHLVVGPIASSHSVVVSFKSTATTLTSLSITGSTSLASGSAQALIATANFTDDTTATVSPSWTLSTGAPATISRSGVLAANSGLASATSIVVSATYTAGNVTKTATINVTIQPAVSGPSNTAELILNGGFESGGMGTAASWVLVGGAATNTLAGSGTYAKTGAKYLLAGGALRESDSCSQLVTIPGSATRAILSFALNITSEDTGTVAQDKLVVQIVAASNGAVVETLGTFSNLDRDSVMGVYRTHSYDITTDNGAPILVRFTSGNDATLITSFRVDDVSLKVTTPTTVPLDSISLSGPTSIGENQTGKFSATAMYSDGSVNTVSNLCVWSVVTGSAYATIDQTGKLSVGNLFGDEFVRILATYVLNGVSATSTFDLTVLNDSTTTHKPNTPINQGPTAGATGVSLTPTLSFSAFVDLDNDAHSISVFQILDPATGKIVWSKEVVFYETSNLTQITVPTGTLLYSRSYQYRVAYRDSSGETSTFSAPTSFTTLSDPTPASSSSMDYRFVTTGGGTAEDVAQGVAIDPITNDVFTTGYFTNNTSMFGVAVSSAGGYDVYVARHSPTGATRWLVSGGGTGDDIAYDIVVSNGKVFIIGTASGTATLAGAGGSTISVAAGLFVAAFDQANGVALWAKNYGNEATAGQNLAVDSNGDIVFGAVFSGTAVVGNSSLTATGGRDCFIAKVGSIDGSIQWIQQITGHNDEMVYAIDADSAGRIYVAGTTRSFDTAFNTVSLTRSTGLFNAFVACYSNAGVIQWAKAYSSQGISHTKALIVDSAHSELYISGIYRGTTTFGSASIDSDKTIGNFFIVKTDLSGNLAWTREFGNSTASCGGYGMPWKDLSIALNPSNGNIEVSALFGGIIQLGTKQLVSRGDWDVLAGEITPSGTWNWVKTAGVANPNHPCWPGDVAVNSAGNVYQVGRYMSAASSPAIFGTANTSALSQGGTDAFLAMLGGGDILFPLTTSADAGRITRSPNAIAYADGTLVTLTHTDLPAMARHGGWGGDTAGATEAGASITIRITKEMTVSAHSVSQAITAAASLPESGGSVAVSNGGFSDVGATVMFTATPVSSCYFVSWNDGITTPVRTVTVPSAGVFLTAIFSDKQRQTINFPLLGVFPPTTTTLKLTASSDSSLPVSFGVVSGSATISGSTLAITSPGKIVVAAYQNGTEKYLAASAVEQTITITDSKPTVPANLAASPVSATGVALTWMASTDDVAVTGYRVFRGGSQVGTCTTTSYFDTGLTSSTAYSYTVAAYDAAGNLSPQSDAANVTTLTDFHDGIPAEWRLKNFGNGRTLIPGVSGPNDDPDGDGVNNFDEFLAGTSPIDARDSMRVTAMTLAAATNGAPGQQDVTITFASVPGKTYLIEGTSDLGHVGVPAVWPILASGITATGTTTVVKIANQTPPHFYRVSLE